MNEYDAQILRGVERDGVRMASGQHIDTAPHTRHRHSHCGRVDMARHLECTKPAHHDGICELVPWDDQPVSDPWVDRRDNDR